LLTQPTSHLVSPAAGTLENAGRTYRKKLSDLVGLYADEAAFDAAAALDGDRIVYQVQDRAPAQSKGDLIFGITQMQPGRIGDEYFLTRGHIHATGNRPEIYYGEAGQGLMLMESPEGETRIIEIQPRVMCYVPPFWIHRAINVGQDALVMTFMYPSDSGQDYGVMHKHRACAATSWKTPDTGKKFQTRPTAPAQPPKFRRSMTAETANDCIRPHRSHRRSSGCCN